MDRYEQICFTLNEKHDELCKEFKNYDPTTFILNNKISILMSEIKELNDEKKKMEDMNNGKES